MDRLDIARGTIDVEIDPGDFAVTHDELLAWVRSGAKAVSTYFGRFPVSHLRLMIAGKGGGHEIHGVTYDGRLIRMSIGSLTTGAELRDDWTMTHEMFHLAFPDMGEGREWLNEGLSVYLEPLARERIGIISKERYWKELMEGLPNGLPEAGDGGLDHTHTWGRTYWGGAMYWFLADVRIREQTKNQKTLDDGIRAVLDAGGDGSMKWSTQRVNDVVDRATGTRVLSGLYSEMSSAPVTPDLGALWKQLGVSLHDGQIQFNDQVPLAEIRRSMMAPSQDIKPGAAPSSAG